MIKDTIAQEVKTNKTNDMTQEDKNLLLKDLCTRLPYVVKYKANILGRENCIETMVAISYRKSKERGYEGIFIDAESGGWDSINDIKLYLRPMSSMTEEEQTKHYYLRNLHSDWEAQDFLNSIHVDYRGLIWKGLALEAPEGMYVN